MTTTNQPSTRFEPGAPPDAGGIPLSVPEIHGNEWVYVKECLDSGWVSSAGPFVERFERDVAAAVTMPHGVAVVSGTAALHVALLVAGVEPDDEVLVSDLSFVAPANAIRYAGAWPVFIGPEPVHWQMDPAAVRAFLEERCERRDDALWNRQSGRRVRALMPVHVLGHPCDMDALTALAGQFNLVMIEDATESLGAWYRDRPVGALSALSCFSFNGNKIITAGGGGMIVTDRPDWASRARYLATQAKDDPIEYVHHAVGFNYRLSNVHAAIGCGQLEQLPSFVAAKRDIAARYRARLAEHRGLTFMAEAPWARSTFWLSTIRVDPAQFPLSSRALMQWLAAAGIQSRPLWTPLHLNPSHAGAESVGTDHALRLHAEALSLPSSVGTSLTDIDRVCDALARAARA